MLDSVELQPEKRFESAGLRCEVWRVIGPPGTGKTTYLSRQIEHAAEKLVKGRSLLACSLTRAAARELASRVADHPRVLVGTLHSHAYKSLGARQAVFSPEDSQCRDEWNAHVTQRHVPNWGMSGGRHGEEGKLSGGDALLAIYAKERARLSPREMWHTKLRTVSRGAGASFVDLYEKFKRDRELIDFSDMIDDAYLYADCGPGIPQYIMVDEAQDLSRDQMRLLLKWAARSEVEKLIIVGDPLQNLYEWRGSEAGVFDEIDTREDRRIVLSQSYRVPRKVSEVARQIAQQMTDVRIDDYQPRDEDGWVRSCDSFRREFTCGGLVEDLLRDHPQKTIMFLATCGYMLTHLRCCFLDFPIAFFNPYNKENGAWNYLREPRQGETTAVQRILGFLSPQETGRLWTYRQLYDWVHLLKCSAFLRRGSKKEIKTLADDRPASRCTIHQLRDWFTDEQELEKLNADPYGWWFQYVAKNKQDYHLYILRMYQEYGADVFYEKPRIILGTIHSVKGGEADIVVLCPDLSPKEAEQYEINENPIHRKFYVGATRAREGLYICDPCGPLFYPELDW